MCLWQLLGDLQASAVLDIYLMMKANIRTVPGLCLYECSNYGSFPSTVDRTLPASRQVLSIPVPHFFRWDLAFLSVMCYQWGCRQRLGLPNYLPLPLVLSFHPTSLDSFCVSPSTTSVLGEHSFFPSIHISAWCSQLSLSESLFCW